MAIPALRSLPCGMDGTILSTSKYDRNLILIFSSGVEAFFCVAYLSSIRLETSVSAFAVTEKVSSVIFLGGGVDGCL